MTTISEVFWISLTMHFDSVKSTKFLQCDMTFQLLNQKAIYVASMHGLFIRLRQKFENCSMVSLRAIYCVLDPVLVSHA